MTEKIADIDFDIIESGDIKEPKLSDTFRCYYSEGQFNIDFGCIKKIVNNEVNIELTSKTIIPEEIILDFLFSVFSSILDYEKEFNKEIIPKNIDVETK